MKFGELKTICQECTPEEIQEGYDVIGNMLSKQVNSSEHINDSRKREEESLE